MGDKSRTFSRCEQELPGCQSCKLCYGLYFLAFVRGFPAEQSPAGDPVTNKKDKKTGSPARERGNTLWRPRVTFGIQIPCQRFVERERERERELRRLRCVSSPMMASWTAGHCTGNENEQTGSSNRGSVNTDTGLYSLSELFERASPKFSYRINTTPPAFTYLLIQTTCHLFSGGKLILSDFNSIQNILLLNTP